MIYKYTYVCIYIYIYRIKCMTKSVHGRYTSTIAGRGRRQGRQPPISPILQLYYFIQDY